MLEALERLLYEKYLETHESLSQKHLTSLKRMSLNESTVGKTLSSADICDHNTKYRDFRKRVSNGDLGETSCFWNVCGLFCH